jgi:hypothetical protein
MSLELAGSGRYFYHYTTWATAAEHILPTGTLRLSPYSRMRDPLESESVMLGAGVSYAPGDEQAQAELMRAHSEAQNLLDRLRSNSKLLSMTVDAQWVHRTPNWSEARFGMGWTRARMWEQYADSHAGVCLVFEREPFEAQVLAQLQERSHESRSGEVYYWRPDRGEWPWPTILLDRSESGTDQGRKHLERHFTDYFFTKLVDWESEYEFRFVEPSETEGYSHVDYGDTLVGLVVGHKFPENLESDAVTLTGEHHVDLAQILWQLNGPSETRLKAQFSETSLKEREWLLKDQ